MPKSKSDQLKTGRVFQETPMDQVKLRPKQLAILVPNMYNSTTGTSYTIGELTLQQCQVLIYTLLREQQSVDRLINAAHKLLEAALP